MKEWDWICIWCSGLESSWLKYNLTSAVRQCSPNSYSGRAACGLFAQELSHSDPFSELLILKWRSWYRIMCYSYLVFTVCKNTLTQWCMHMWSDSLYECHRHRLNIFLMHVEHKPSTLRYALLKNRLAHREIFAHYDINWFCRVLTYDF